MLVGCLAIIGTGIPFVAGFSGFYSKDSIIAQTLSFSNHNPVHKILFYAAAGGASITAFYMFRLWFMTFIGKPRDHHVYEHAHESPKVMYMPLVVLAVFAFGDRLADVGADEPVGTSAAGGNGGNGERRRVVAGNRASSGTFEPRARGSRPRFAHRVFNGTWRISVGHGFLRLAIAEGG